jgi:hypothetical protein
MSSKFVMGCVALFILATIITISIDGVPTNGVYLTEGDQSASILDSLEQQLVIHNTEPFGLDLPNIKGFATLMLKMTTWDYQFLPTWFRLFLFPLTVGVVFGLVQMATGLIQGIASILSPFRN